MTSVAVSCYDDTTIIYQITCKEPSFKALPATGMTDAKRSLLYFTRAKQNTRKFSASPP